MFSNHIFSFTYFQFLRSFSLTFILILNQQSGRDWPYENILPISWLGTAIKQLKLKLSCLIAWAKFLSAMRTFHHPALVGNYQTRSQMYLPDLSCEWYIIRSG